MQAERGRERRFPVPLGNPEQADRVEAPPLLVPPDDLRPAPAYPKESDRAAEKHSPLPPHLEGRRLSMFFTKIYTRIVTPLPRYLDPGLPPEVSTRAPVARAWWDLDHALNDLITASGVAA